MLYFFNILKKLIALIKGNKFLILMMLLLILVREGMVIFDMWTTEEGGDLLEALISGNFAFDVLDGSWRGWNAYFYARLGHLGNEFMYSLFTIPLYALFGNSLFVLCQVQIISSLVILLLMYSFCKWYLGDNIAKIASLLFVCFPVNIQGWLIYPYYAHFDNALYTLLAFLFFVKLRDSQRLRYRILYSSLLGIISGIGYFHSEMYSLTIGCVLFFWFLKDKLFFARGVFFAFILGLLIGMIPSIYFGLGSHIDFFSQLFSGKFAEAGRVADSYWMSLGLMSMGFWPIRNLFFFTIDPAVVTLLGMSLLIVTALWVKAQGKFYLPFYLILFYAFLFMFITFIFRGTYKYYFHPLLVPSTMLLSVLIYNLQSKWFIKGYLKSGFYAILLLICFTNLYQIIRHFDFKSTFPRLKKQLRINGCCYYWPNEYFPPVGLKTGLTAEVEAIARETRFSERYSIDESIPYKKVYINDRRTARFSLSSLQSYMVYGKDASFTGLEQLAKEIQHSVADEAKPFAYGGLAVYYVNDNWLKDLLKYFKQGIIEKNIPEEFQRYFYMELARKIINRYQGNRAKINKILNMFDDKQKEWMLNTQLSMEPHGLAPLVTSRRSNIFAFIYGQARSFLRRRINKAHSHTSMSPAAFLQNARGGAN